MQISRFYTAWGSARIFSDLIQNESSRFRNFPVEEEENGGFNQTEKKSVKKINLSSRPAENANVSFVISFCAWFKFKVGFLLTTNIIYRV